jgi:hypothetical protein
MSSSVHFEPPIEATLDDRLKPILNHIRDTGIKREMLNDYVVIAQIKAQFHRCGFRDSKAFMKELETRLQALDLSAIRHNHDHEADDWVKEVLLDTVRRSLKDA